VKACNYVRSVFNLLGVDDDTVGPNQLKRENPTGKRLIRVWQSFWEDGVQKGQSRTQDFCSRDKGGHGDITFHLGLFRGDTLEQPDRRARAVETLQRAERVERKPHSEFRRPPPEKFEKERMKS